LQDEVSPDAFKGFRKWGVWGANKLGVSEKEYKRLSKQELEEFWMAFGVFVSIAVGYSESGENVGELDDLVSRFLELVGRDSGEGVAREVKEAWVSGGGLKERVKRLLERFLEIKNYPRLEELAGFLVRRGRCLCCFEKLQWKWGGRQGPLITSDHKVYKLGWGVVVLVSKESEDEEFWYF
jgi:hypothetical protein